MVHTVPPMRPRRLLAALLATAAGTVAPACSSSDGRELPPPRVPQTTTSTTTPGPVLQPGAGSVDVFTLASESFADGTEIPARLTCEGEGLSPALAWSGTPLDASSLAIVARDLDAGGFVHWVVTGIDPFVEAVGEGGLPENAVEGTNGTGTIGWAGPCPPAGSGTHTYEIAVLALAEAVPLPPEAPAQEAAAALEAAAVDRAVLTGTVASG